MWQSGSDAALSVASTINYMQAMEKAVGPADAAAATRLHVAPGVNHCMGGVGPDQIDLLTALDHWVTAASAPADLIAQKLDENGGVIRSLPLCQYPRYPQYEGLANDVAAAKSAANSAVRPNLVPAFEGAFSPRSARRVPVTSIVSDESPSFSRSSPVTGLDGP